MRRFLNSIGDNIQYLRAVRLPGCGRDWRGRFNEASEAFEVLASATTFGFWKSHTSMFVRILGNGFTTSCQEFQ